jgi:hypothetical protein
MQAFSGWRGAARLQAVRQQRLATRRSHASHVLLAATWRRWWGMCAAKAAARAHVEAQVAAARQACLLAAVSGWREEVAVQAAAHAAQLTHTSRILARNAVRRVRLPSFGADICIATSQRYDIMTTSYSPRAGTSRCLSLTSQRCVLWSCNARTFALKANPHNPGSSTCIMQSYGRSWLLQAVYDLLLHPIPRPIGPSECMACLFSFHPSHLHSLHLGVCIHLNP